MTPSAGSSSSALQDYFSHVPQDLERPSLPSRTHSASYLADHDSSHSKERSHLEIALDAQHLILKGTGVDVESTRLSGHVTLHLVEDTSLKEITLQFRGKGRIPAPASDSWVIFCFINDVYILTYFKSLLSANSSSVTHVICNQEWSFLKGDKRHARTVKAGRHTFSFQSQIGGSLPSSLGTSAFGGASISYKLRAIAVRSGLSSNLQAVLPVYIIRSFGHEALEYQQTLEIENTWPEKIMYSITLPHKAWALGDTLTTILKFSPIAKGVCVSHIKTTVQETTKVYARGGTQENVNTVAAINHAITDGKATVADPRSRYLLANQNASTMQSPRSPIAGPSTSVSGDTSPTGLRSPDSPSFPVSSYTSTTVQENEETSDVTVTLRIPLPIISITPSHSVEPIIVSHRVRWSILLRNLDGHTSELRCSLPVHILDHRLLEEARSFSAATRRLVLGSSGALPEEETDRELPSYAAHIRDRVANMYLPEASTVRINNPWIHHVNPQLGTDTHDSSISIPPSRAHSGYSSPLEPHVLSQLPQAPDSDGIPTLDLLHSELLLSLSDSHLRQDRSAPEPNTPSEQITLDSSQSSSQNQSGSQSRHNSRPASPEGSHHHDSATTHHASNHGRNRHNILRALTSFSSPHSLFSRHGSHQSADEGQHSRSHSGHSDFSGQQPHRSGTDTPSEGVNGADLLHRIMTEVPDYSIASRGFIGGGVPPLESMRGLPSYEEAAHEHE